MRKSDVNVQKLLEYTSRTIEEACNKFIGYPNDGRTREALDQEVRDTVRRIMDRNGVRRPLPKIEVGTDPMKPELMVLTFRHPETDEILSGTELYKYLGLL